MFEQTFRLNKLILMLYKNIDDSILISVNRAFLYIFRDNCL